MQLAGQLVFVAILALAIFIFYRNISRIISNIKLGKDEKIEGDTGRRWNNVLLLAFGQKKMFRNPMAGILHFFVYAGFIIINIEILEIILDGILGTHRLFLPALGGFYTFLINFFEILALAVIIVCGIFLVRRNFNNIRRFTSGDLNGWPRSDANFILITEIVLMTLFLTMNAADRALQLHGMEHYRETGDFIISGHLANLFTNTPTNVLIGIERTAWWIHIIGILAFLNYLPYSKHLHILFAFPNAYYAPLQPMGKMENMPAIQNEVLYAMEPEKAPTNAAADMKFGARDVADLSWKNILDAYTCTECGRCSAACPANITGKKLSPRKIMMDTRDRAEEYGNNVRANGGTFIDDGKTLLHDYITPEELRACTTCNACVQECPVSISPLDIILELRRNLIMEESNAPAEWNGMFSNIENNFAPWKFSPDDRDAWAK